MKPIRFPTPKGLNIEGWEYVSRRIPSYVDARATAAKWAADGYAYVTVEPLWFNMGDEHFPGNHTYRVSGYCRPA